MGIKIRSIKFNFVMNLILTGSSMLFPLISFPIVSRALNADGYGLCSWAVSVANVFSLFALLGINRYGIRVVASCRDDLCVLNKVTKELLFVTLCTTLLSVALFVVLILTIDQFYENRLLLLINAITIVFNTMGVGWFFQGIEQYSFITTRNLIIKIVVLIGIVILIHTPEDYFVYAMLLVLSGALANLVNFMYMLYILRDEKLFDGNVSIENLFNFLKESLLHVKPLLVFFAITAAISVYTLLDTVMLGFLSTQREVGYYTAAVNVKSALVAVVSALTGVLLPRASNMISNGKLAEYKDIIKRCIALVLIVSVPLAAILYVFSTPLITWYAGEGFSSAGSSVAILALAVVPIALSLILCDAVMVPLGQEKICMWIYFTAAALNFVCNLFLIPSLGAVGASISTLLVEIFITVTLTLAAFFLKKSGKLFNDSSRNLVNNQVTR